jgi:hypothetical protein
MTDSDCPALRARGAGVPKQCAAAAIVISLVLAGALLPGASALPMTIAAASDSQPPVVPHGPTLHLTAERGNGTGDPVVDFMYFVALISPEPVSMLQSPGNTQRTRLLKATRHVFGSSFTVSGEFEFDGNGYQRNVFDHSAKIRQNDNKLRNGGLLDHQLGSISVEGAGLVTIEVEGHLTEGRPEVTEVRIRFGGRGRPSPVTIDLYDVRYVGGSVQRLNEIVARVNTLTFRRQSGPAKMELSVASVKRKDAGDSSWENLVGKVKATAANLILDPVDVDALGNEAMLRFGLALAQQTPEFTFPIAKNLR